MSETTKNRGWQVTMAGLGINLALGVLYAWSIFKGAIKTSIEQGGPDAFQWSMSSINDPYAASCLVFAFAMILAGKCQDKIGPARTALIGGILVGSGFTLMSFSNSYAAWSSVSACCQAQASVSAMPQPLRRPSSGSLRPRPA